MSLATYKQLAKFDTMYLYVEAILQLIPVNVVIFNGYALFCFGEGMYASQLYKDGIVMDTAEPVLSQDIPESVRQFAAEYSAYIRDSSAQYRNLTVLSKDDLGRHRASLKR